jgi:hypothetical protein
MTRTLSMFMIFSLVSAGSLYANHNFRWKGQVDGVDEIQIRGDRVRINHLEAQPVQNQDFGFSEPLPRREVHLMLNKIAGRGIVRVLEEPSSWNDYTATVLVDDGQHNGSDYYEFELGWRSDEWDDWENNDWDHSQEWNSDYFDQRREGLFRWSGRVDIGAEIAIRGNSHDLRDQGGSGTQERQARFLESLPRAGVPVSLHKVQGRGRVELVQTPNAGNDYVAVVRITDEKSGAGDYEFELSWRR